MLYGVVLYGTYECRWSNSGSLPRVLVGDFGVIAANGPLRAQVMNPHNINSKC